MSIEVMTLVWKAYPGGGSELLCALALADWCNDDGDSLHPSIAAIARKIRVSPDQARRIVRSFEQRGLLAVVGNAGGGKPGTTRQYRLNVPMLRKFLADKLAAEAVAAAVSAETPWDVSGAPGTACTDATPGTHASPGTGATPGTDARGGLAPMQGDALHPCKGTAGTHASLTTIEPSSIPSGEPPSPPPSAPAPAPATAPVKLAERKPEDVELPGWVPAEAWEAFADMRRRKKSRAPWTYLAAVGIVRELVRLRAQGEDAGDVLWQSARNGWSDVYPVKGGGDGARRGFGESPREARARRFYAESTGGILGGEAIDG